MLLLHRPLSGRATGVPTTDTQVAWQDTRRNDVKSRASISAMNISTSNTLLLFVLGTTVARMNALRMLCLIQMRFHMGLRNRWRAKPLFDPCNCLLAFIF